MDPFRFSKMTAVAARAFTATIAISGCLISVYVALNVRWWAGIVAMLFWLGLILGADAIVNPRPRKHDDTWHSR